MLKMNVNHVHNTETAISKAVFVFKETNNVLDWKYVKDSETGYIAINKNGLQILTIKASKDIDKYVISFETEEESNSFDCPLELLKLTDPSNSNNNSWRKSTKEFHRLLKLARRKAQNKRNTAIACKGDFLQVQFVSDHDVKYGTLYKFVERVGNQYHLHNLQNDRIEIVNAHYMNKMKLGQV